MPQEDSKKIFCRKCSIELTDENKIKKHNLCKTCNKIICKEYKQKNKKVISDYNKKYKSEHKEEISKYNQKYNISNRKSIQKRHTEYLREKRKSDPNYKISVTCRNRIKKLVKEQFPNESTKGIGLYGWMRATQLRRLRAPAPQVEIAGRKRKK